MNEKKIDINLMLKNLKKAVKKNEVPVAAYIVNNNKIIAKSYNKREKFNDVLGHAEIICIKKAAKKLKRWNLSDCDLYVSLKPCSMCSEIIKQSKIKNAYYFLEKPTFKHEYNKTNFIKENIQEFNSTYKQLLKDFFSQKRK